MILRSAFWVPFSVFFVFLGSFIVGMNGLFPTAGMVGGGIGFFFSFLFGTHDETPGPEVFRSFARLVFAVVFLAVHAGAFLLFTSFMS